MLSLTNFAAEMEREKGAQRVHDAMLRKARAGRVTGGRVFGYENREICAEDGQRLHVVRRIHAQEAAVVRRVFEAFASGLGTKRIAKLLNEDRCHRRGTRDEWFGGFRCELKIEAINRVALQLLFGAAFPLAYLERINVTIERLLDLYE